jgi:hypothetical protein
MVIACSNPGAEFDTAAQAPPSDPNARAPGRPTPGHEWAEVWEKVTACGAAKCSGAQGFGVTSDGHYYVGPAEPQSTSRGMLSVTEQEIVSKAALAVATQELTPSARCFTGDPAPGAPAELSLRELLGGTRDPVAIYETTEGGKRTCLRGDLSLAQSLRDALAPLLAKYDPAPVPSPRPTSTPTPRPSFPFPWPFP